MSTTLTFPLSSRPGKFPEEGQGRLLNCYTEQDGASIGSIEITKTTSNAGGEGKTVWRRAPGMTQFATLPEGGVRGAMLAGASVLVATATGMSRLNSDGTNTPVFGQLSGTGPVTIVRNNKAPLFDTAIVTNAGVQIVDQTNGDVLRPYSTGVATSEFVPADMPEPNSVSFLDGYFIFTTASGFIFASNLNSTDVSALSFNENQLPSHSGGLVRGVVSGSQFYAFGPSNTEVYQDAGTSPFPLSRATVIPIGLLGPWAIAGVEDGWSGSLIFVASDGTVCTMAGYTPTRISTSDVERSIKTVSDPTQLVARVYVHSGNAIWSLSSPTFTWEYNATQGQWHERESQGLKRWRGDVTVNAFGEWLVSDVLSANIAIADQDAQDELGSPFIWGADSALVKAFPQRLRIPDAMFDFVVGQGLESATAPDQQDPQVEISWSHDGGNMWSRPVLRSIGRQGRYKKTITVRNMGQAAAAGFRMRFRISDARPTTFLGASLDAVPRRP